MIVMIAMMIFVFVFLIVKMSWSSVILSLILLIGITIATGVFTWKIMYHISTGIRHIDQEMEEYFNSLYGLRDTDRLFPFTKSYMHSEMLRGCKASGVKVIRIHDLRHSHISLLINMGFSAVAIGNRVGHESADITYRYAHMFPTEQTNMANRLNIERSASDDEKEERRT